MDRRPITEIAVSTLVAGICAVFLIQALKLPPGTFEPLGSGPVPIFTASIVILCCVVVAIQAARRLRREGNVGATFAAEFSARAPGKALLLLLATLAYVAALDIRVASFGIVTSVYLVALIWALSDFRLRVLPAAVLCAVVSAFGAEYLFTHVFVVDLPA